MNVHLEGTKPVDISGKDMQQVLINRNNQMVQYELNSFKIH